MWENDELRNNANQPEQPQTPGPVAPQQQTSYSGSASSTGYGQQNAWNNPYANRYNQGQANTQYSNTGYNYTNSTFSGSWQEPPTPKKKKGAGKVVFLVTAIVAVMALLVLGLYAVSQRITARNDGRGASVAQVEEQENADSFTEKSPKSETPVKNEKTEPKDTPAEKPSNDGNRVTTLSAESPVVVTDVTRVVAACMPSIVAIDNNYTQTINYFGQRYTQEGTGSGSGIIVGKSDTELLIVTNHHVIEGADSIKVHFVDDSTVDAEVKDYDEDMDLAVISIPLDTIEQSTLDAIVIATLGDSDALVLGEPVIAIGNALGQGQSVTTGVVSALNREITFSGGKTGTFIQTDAAINPGNSGGALLNSAGEVIGINSNKYMNTSVEGMCFAIPISAAQPIIDEMMNREIITDDERGYLGITGATVPYEYTGIQGVRIRAVTKGTGAEKAGLREDDIIVALDGEIVKSMDSLHDLLQYHRAGDTVTVTILRRDDSGYREGDIDLVLTDAETAGIYDDDEASAPQENQTPAEGEDGNYYYFDGDDFPFSFPFFGGSN